MEENQKPVTPTQPPPPVQNAPVETQPSSINPIKPASKFSIKAIIGTIIFLLLAGGAAAGYVYREPILKLVSNTPSPTPSPIVTITTTPDPTADWKTYEDPKYSYTIKYPDNYKLSNEVQPSGQTEPSYGLCLKAPNNDYSPCDITIEFSPYLENLELEKMLEEYNFRMHGYPEIIPSKVSVSEYSWDKDAFVARSDTEVTYWVAQKENYVELYSTTDRLNLQILSTFKFTNTATTAPTLSKEGESCGPNAGQAGNAQCEDGLTCLYETPESQENKIGTCVKDN